MYKQLIIARKDLNMSPGKLAAQVSHASMAFLIYNIRNSIEPQFNFFDEIEFYHADFFIDKQVYDLWFNGAFTKIVCEARNKSNLLRAVEIAKSLGLEEKKDYFLIRDNCLTELEPEDEDGRTLTCIGFAPMSNEIVEQISKKYQLYR
jgi:PTH2 family peptidyl-tRNA hydrolase